MFSNKKMQSGFTLIELMIVIGIIAILAAIAYPTYQNYLIRSHIEAARSEMMDNIRMMEDHYNKNRTMCATTNSTDGTCASMPTPIQNKQADSYDTTIHADAFNGSKGNSYIISSKPNSNSKFSDNTKTNRDVNLLYYSNGSGFVKCTAAAHDAALKETGKPTSGSSGTDGTGCTVM